MSICIERGEMRNVEEKQAGSERTVREAARSDLDMVVMENQEKRVREQGMVLLV